MAKRKSSPPRQSAPEQVKPTHPSAGFFRRLGSWVYDALIVLSLLIIGGFIGLGVAYLLLALGLTQLEEGKDMADLLSHSLLYTAWLAAIITGFYAWFWVRAGQTIGMRAWRLRVQNKDGSNITLTQALIRMATSAFGLGTLMVLFSDKSFQDIWAECEMVVLTKEENLEQLNK